MVLGELTSLQKRVLLAANTIQGDRGQFAPVELAKAIGSGEQQALDAVLSLQVLEPKRSDGVRSGSAEGAVIVHSRDVAEVTAKGRVWAVQLAADAGEQRRTQIRLRSYAMVILAMSGAAIGVVSLSVRLGIPWPSVVAVLGMLVGTFVFYSWQVAQLGASSHLFSEAAELRKKLKEDFFTKLVDINFNYIEQYYDQTRRQAGKSFALSAIAAVASFGIIIAGVWAMYRGETTPAYVTTAAGVLGEFIATVFFYLYSQTVQKMGQYHQKLVITQNVALALKITEGLPGDAQAEAKLILVRALTKNVNRYLSNHPQEGDRRQAHPRWAGRTKATA